MNPSLRKLFFFRFMMLQKFLTTSGCENQINKSLRGFLFQKNRLDNYNIIFCSQQIKISWDWKSWVISISSEGSSFSAGWGLVKVDQLQIIFIVSSSTFSLLTSIKVIRFFIKVFIIFVIFKWLEYFAFASKAA